MFTWANTSLITHFDLYSPVASVNQITKLGTEKKLQYNKYTEACVEYLTANIGGTRS